MLHELSQDLNNLQKISATQQQQLNNIYLSLEEINIKKQLIDFGYKPKKNLFESVRPEVIFQIADFLNLEQFINLRLFSKQMDLIIKTIFPLKSKQIKEQLIFIESKLEQQDLELSQRSANEEDLFNEQLIAAQLQIQQISGNSLCELRSLNCPPPVLEIIGYCLIVLFKYEQCKTQNKWTEYKKLSIDNYFKKYFLQIDVSEITEEQLELLAPIDQIAFERVLVCSLAAASFYQFIKVVLDIRRSPLYQIKYQMQKLSKQIVQKKKQINNLSKQ